MSSTDVLPPIGLLATVPSNPNGNGENSTNFMGFQTGDVSKDVTASSGERRLQLVYTFYPSRKIFHSVLVYNCNDMQEQ